MFNAYTQYRQLFVLLMRVAGDRGTCVGWSDGKSIVVCSVPLSSQAVGQVACYVLL